MKVDMTVTYDREDVFEAMKKEYIGRFGNPPDGFELDVRSNYSDQVIISTVEKEEDTLPPAVDVPAPVIRELAPGEEEVKNTF